jgi:hypothetical protein
MCAKESPRLLQPSAPSKGPLTLPSNGERDQGRPGRYNLTTRCTARLRVAIKWYQDCTGACVTGMCHDSRQPCGYRLLPHPSQEDGALIPAADGAQCSLTFLPGGQGSSENQGQTALLIRTVSTSRTWKRCVTIRRRKMKSLILPSVQTIDASPRRWNYKPWRRYVLL